MVFLFVFITFEPNFDGFRMIWTNPEIQNDYAIITSRDVTVSGCGRQRRHFQTYYLPSKSHCDSFYILRVTEGGGGRIPQLLRHVTSQSQDADVKGDIFRHTIYPPSLIVIAFIFSELRRGGGAESAPPPSPVVEDRKKPGLNRVNRGFTVFEKSSSWTVFKIHFFNPFPSKPSLAILTF